MNKVLTHYQINEQTLALLPAFHFDYDTIVLEVDRTLYVKMKPLQLVEQACLDGGATYEGRRGAVTYQTGAKRKVPIPICPQRNLFTFPTQSPSEFTCHWIFYTHVHAITPCRTTKKSNIKAIITFKNGQQLPMSESYYLLQRQMQRTAICILHYTDFQNHRFTI